MVVTTLSPFVAGCKSDHGTVLSRAPRTRKEGGRQTGRTHEDRARCQKGGGYATVAVEQRRRREREKNLVMTALYQTGPQGEAEASLGRGPSTPPPSISLAHPPCGLSFSHFWSSAAGVIFLLEQSPWEFAHGVTRDGGKIYGGRRRRAVGDPAAGEKHRGRGR